MMKMIDSTVLTTYIYYFILKILTITTNSKYELNQENKRTLNLDANNTEIKTLWLAESNVFV